MTVDQVNVLINALIAAATIGTLIWAVRTTLAEGRRSREERAERRAFDERAQASRVVAWERQWVELEDGADPRELRELCVHNTSDTAVFDVTVHFPLDPVSMVGDPPEDGFHWWSAVIPPSPEPRKTAVEALGYCMKIGDDETLIVTFRDGSGRYWEREIDGQLVRRFDLEALTEEQRREARHDHHRRELAAVGIEL